MAISDIFWNYYRKRTFYEKIENLWVEEKAYWVGGIQVWVTVLARHPKSRARRRWAVCRPWFTQQNNKKGGLKVLSSLRSLQLYKLRPFTLRPASEALELHLGSSPAPEQWFSTIGALVPRGQLAVFGDIFDCHNWRGGQGAIDI